MVPFIGSDFELISGKKTKSRTKTQSHVLYALRKEMILDNKDKQKTKTFFWKKKQKLWTKTQVAVYMPYGDKILKQYFHTNKTTNGKGDVQDKDIQA